MASQHIRDRNRRLGMILIGIFIVLLIGSTIGVITLNWNAPWRATPGGW